MTTRTEVHVESLLGRRVYDRDGEVVGRIEEFRIDEVDGETVVVEFHAGPAALLERLGGAALRLPFLRAIPFVRREYLIPWQVMDLSKPDRPRLSCRVDELRRVKSDHYPNA